jgi:hypothetical protein
MTVVICTNEHDLLWVFDDRLACRWFSKPSTPVGEYWSIAAAFVGEPLEIVYLQETASSKILLADPHWMGILSYLGIEMNNSQTGILSEYPDFVSPHGSMIKLAASDFIQESLLPGFDLKIFSISAGTRYNLQPSQVATAIRYAERIDNNSSSDLESLFKLNAIFQKIEDIDTAGISDELERINNEITAQTPLVNDLMATTEQIVKDPTDLRYILPGLEHCNLDSWPE